MSERGLTVAAYRPEQRFSLGLGGSSGEGVGLFVTVLTNAPEDLRVRIRQRYTDFTAELQRASGPSTPGQQHAAAEPRPYTMDMRAEMSRGEGFFWLDEVIDAQGGEYRFAVVVPDSLLGAIADVDMYVTTTEDGSPIGADRISLTRDFYYMVILGDSVAWGNGLPETAKMSTLVSEVIERETGRLVIRQRYAHSGAKIVPSEGDGICLLNCVGEVPTISTSITVQADLIERPEMMDLILMDGCINDVGVENIINPLNLAVALEERTRIFCETEMTTLLRKVRGLAPQATIVVTGYFQIVGPESDPLAMQQWMTSQGMTPDDDEEHLIEKLVRNSLAFADTAHAGLTTAVATVNAEHPGVPAAWFADPQFGAENAVFTSQRWLWSLGTQSLLLSGLDLGLELFPEDPQEFLRVAACFHPDVLGGLLFCLYASVGHPNLTGERAYANAILRQLHQAGMVSDVQLDMP